MKKSLMTLTIMLAVAAMVAAFSCPAQAAVSGPCVECHTMHNSQGGIPMRVDDVVEPLSALLLDTCLGCHTNGDTGPYVGGYPFVKSSSGSLDDDLCLAGGFFQVTADTDDDNSNENHDIGSMAVPAGFDSGETTWYTGTADGLGCAGTNGCHGNEIVLDDMAAIAGGHHAPTAYRILYVGDEAVIGSGAKDYEAAIIATPTTGVVTSGDTQNVNIYSADVINETTISELCAKCHGDFHNESGTTGDVGVASPWIRHPTDVVIPSTWTIAGATLIGVDYKHNPVGWDDADYNVGEKKATCLSCHRAHGTDNQDLLRWGYVSTDPGGATQSAGDSSITYGCLGCHDRQR